VDLTKGKFTLGRADAGAAIVVTVTPRAGKDEIVGMQGDVIKIRLAAPPAESAANAALVEFLARCLGVRPNAVEIVAGHSMRQKLVSIIGLSPAEVTAKLFP
jgi:uncharacterized protein (TIGR00251 family)